MMKEALFRSAYATLHTNTATGELVATGEFGGQVKQVITLSPAAVPNGAQGASRIRSRIGILPRCGDEALLKAGQAH
jgi:hypothetical protein